MARPAKTGRYSVPKEISALAPTDIKCFVKIVYTETKAGIVLHYYVYESIYITNPKYPNKGKHSSGLILGKIEGGKFVPNDNYRQLIHQDAQPVISDNGNSAKSVPEKKDLAERDAQLIAQAAANLNLDLCDIDLQIKKYGEFAIVLSCTESVLRKLEKHFSDKDARMIYALSIINFIMEYTPASYIKEIYDQSILSNKWPTLPISENNVNSFIKLLGGHPEITDEYCQDLIDESSRLTAIDGHVILSCSKNNELADYGNKYQEFGDKQINLLQAYDVENNTPLASKAYEGGLPDKTAVQDLFDCFHFPQNTCFLIDKGFYSDDNMELFRSNDCHFIIPVVESTGIGKAMLSSLVFTDSFVYEKVDESGEVQRDVILYRESTVGELEDIYQKMLQEEADRKNEEAVANCQPGTKPVKHYARKIKRSDYPNDRIILYRDTDWHDKEVRKYREKIGADKEHTEENLAKLSPGFGTMMLRTNFPATVLPAPMTFPRYKRRWGVETHYNFLENTMNFTGLKQSDHLGMDGLSFLTVTFGQIKSAFVKRMKASSAYVSHLSIKECLVKAARLKFSRHADKTWHVNITTSKNAQIFLDMGVNVADDLRRFNANLY